MDQWLEYVYILSANFTPGGGAWAADTSRLPPPTRLGSGLLSQRDVVPRGPRLPGSRLRGSGAAGPDGNLLPGPLLCQL
ncbi:unnamed protein product [Lota lota]